MRVKRGVTTKKRHNAVKKSTKGMQHTPRTSFRIGKQTVLRSLQYSYRDRRNRKRDFRKLWIQRINSAARENNTTYSALIAQFKKHEVTLNRKVLSEVAFAHPKAFKDIVTSVKK